MGDAAHVESADVHVAEEAVDVEVHHADSRRHRGGGVHLLAAEEARAPPLELSARAAEEVFHLLAQAVVSIVRREAVRAKGVRPGAQGERAHAVAREGVHAGPRVALVQREQKLGPTLRRDGGMGKERGPRGEDG